VTRLTRRQVLTWWRRPPQAAHAVAPPSVTLARLVEPTAVVDPEPFSLEAFYSARAKPEGR
jgi:hypothetical protein